MRVLITRPSEDAEPLAERLRALGVEALVEPLLTVTIDRAAAPDLDGVQAILATSANGVRAFAALSERRDIPLLAVGDATARAAREAGFRHFESAAGAVEDLAALAMDRCEAARGALLHVAGSKLAGDLGGRLEKAGFAYRRAGLYAAQPAARLSAETTRALKAGELDGVLFFSPRTAETFASLVRRGRLSQRCRRLAAFCLSEAVAERARTLAWRRIVVAARPDQESLLALLTDPNQGPWGTMTESSKTPSESADRPEDKAAVAAEGPEPTAGTPETPEAAGLSARPETDAAPETEPVPPKAPKPASLAGMVPVALLTGLFLLAVLGGALYAAWPFWSPYVAGYVREVAPDPLRDPPLKGLPGRVAALEKTVKDGGSAGDALAEMERKRAEIAGQLDVLVKRVDGLDKSLESVRAMVKAADLPIQAADARKALDELSQRVSKLERTDVGTLARGVGRLDAENAQMAQSVATLTKRVDDLETARTTAAGLSDRARAVIVAAGQLREVLRTSGPFADELAALKKVAGGEADLAGVIDRLAPYADTGIPVLAVLKGRFGAMATAAAAAAHRVAGDDWMTSAVNRLAALVTIRRTDGAGGDDSADGLLARAQKAMDEGDLMAAVKALDGLKDGPAQAAASWLGQAKARVAAERAMAVLHVQIVSLIAPTGQ